MTYREYMQINHPEIVTPEAFGGVIGCPYHHWSNVECLNGDCERCWNREIKDNQTENKREEKIMPTNYTTLKPVISEELAPTKSIIETSQELHCTLIEIEGLARRINDMLFGPSNSDLCTGQPDCLQANAVMSLNLALMIREELYRIQNGLGGM